MGNLITEAISMGWMALAIIAGLMVYFQVSISDPVAKKRAVFKTFIGLVSCLLMFMAIANYKTNFYGESRLLPVSLVMITVTTFVMALYFTNLSALLKIGGMMFFIAAFLSGYGNWLPQVEGGFPPVEEKVTWDTMSTQQLADKGEEIIFGGVGKNKEQGAIGKGQCPLCHAFHAGMLGERAPNLLGLPTRKERLEDPKYSKGDPSKRIYSVKEAFPGSGTAETVQEYIAESHACPSCYVVEGYGVKGTNDKESPMPAIHKPPISLSLPELAAVDTWMYVREGVEPPSFDELVKSYEKFVPEADRPKEKDDKPAGATSLMADGTEPVDQILAKAQCVACHTIPGIPGAVGTVGPKLEEGTTAPQRIKEPDYKGTAKTATEYIMESIVDPSAYVVKPFPDNTMPKVFGQKLSAGALKKIVDYLSQVKAGAPPPKIS
ncbi:MAG: nitric oxide reductase [Nitrospira sp.]|nr:c-type cytochrome [Nitrospira sp.]MDR4464139.1 nitric oxide reductase [Nitrospira sp.]MDR4468375.1 nitric oxide reductase [Nitrospira sp.]